jgi:hypothetical protein
MYISCSWKDNIKMDLRENLRIDRPQVRMYFGKSAFYFLDFPLHFIYCEIELD